MNQSTENTGVVAEIIEEPVKELTAKKVAGRVVSSEEVKESPRGFRGISAAQLIGIERTNITKALDKLIKEEEKYKNLKKETNAYIAACRRRIKTLERYSGELAQ